MPTATFAQLCQTLTEIEETAGIHVFNLYNNVEESGSYPYTQTGKPWIMPSGDFLEAFYDWKETSHGNGQFTIDCSSQFMEILHWKVLNYPFTTPTGSGFLVGASDLRYNSAELLSLVTQTWALDLSNNSTECWTSCSYMNILKELLVARNICNFGGCAQGGPCCSLNASELAAILNQQDPSGVGGFRTGYAPRPTDYSGILLTGGPVAVGDKLVLAILFKNPHIGARNIELRLHFKIINAIFDGPSTTPSVWP